MHFSIEVHNNTPMISSLDIAKQFGRSHGHVMKSIKSKLGRDEIVTTSYVDSQGKKQPMLLLSKRAALIAMPFIGGKKSEEGQRALVDAYLAYEELSLAQPTESENWQIARTTGQQVRRSITDSIKLLVDYTVEQGEERRRAEIYYPILTDFVNKCLGIRPVQFGSTRDSLGTEDLFRLMTVEHGVAVEMPKILAKGLTHNKACDEVKSYVYDSCKAMPPKYFTSAIADTKCLN